MKPFVIPICSILFLLCAGLSSCQQSEDYPKQHKAPKKTLVLTTTAPVYSFTKNITGDAASVENLLPSGTDPHEYSLTPGDMLKLSQAQIIIINGAGLEKWLDKIISYQLKKKPIVVDSASGVHIIDNDPHIWLSPRNAMVQVKNIRDALIEADPANSETYRKNADIYIERLRTLDREIMENTSALRKKEFISLHSAFIYFAKDYGLRQAAVIQEYPEKEPTPGHIAKVITIIRKNNIKVIFSEPMVSHKIVKTIAKDLKLQVYILDTLERGDLYPEWYEERMRANLETLRTALNQ